jgi:hypothetical protein
MDEIKNENQFESNLANASQKVGGHNCVFFSEARDLTFETPELLI